MQILMISDVYFPRVNGVSTSIQTFVEEFLAQGHQVTLIAPAYPAEHVADFEVIRIPSRRLPVDKEDRLMRRRAIRRLIPDLRAKGFDILHIHTPFIAHYAGMEIAAALDLPVVVSYHTYFEAYFEKYLPWLPSGWLRGAARRLSRTQCNAIDGVISPSVPMLERLRVYGVETRAAVIPTGLPLRQYQGCGKNGFRARHGIADTTPLLLYVGRAAFEKNIGFLMNVFQRVHARRPDVKWVIAGEGPALPWLKARARKLGLQRHILFMGYLQRETELLDCYASCDLFMFASETETQGLVLLEAMACGLPVISTACMGTRDVLKDGAGCRIADPDERDFSDRVLELLDDRELARELASRGEDYVQVWSSVEKARQMLDFYGEVTCERQRGPDTNRLSRNQLVRDGSSNRLR